ncbi:adenosylcobinamide-GDP ribazoletransferase [Gordonia rubripertincta]|uniref:Adenosylcobinamide-GDP ribazoletransferase n=1 Tax=Gordonia rubripertincta TaxID=36822 RepID=A0ABT4MPW1_GORRU|nr:adenosylcobinamide-GDP ribazoletransferase [Gordonia rubripertincta]MCZ4549042.1 adenosylcobinamide-GDP ribazoletransferase [Gordonia rubripertincta]
MSLRGAIRGPQTAFSWLTILPVPEPAGPFDRSLGGAAIGSTPLVGCVLGAIAAAAAIGLDHTELPVLLCGLLIVGLLAVLTRGMHLDGLADTADGLGCYGPPARVHQVMHSGSTGPFGAATLVIVMGAQAVGYGTLMQESNWAAFIFVGFVSRVATVIGCRISLPPAAESKFGGLTAATQRLTIPFWVLGALAVGFAVGPELPVPGVIAAVVVTVFAWLFSAHCAQRFGGMNGDVLGALIELSTLIALCVVLAG